MKALARFLPVVLLSLPLAAAEPPRDENPRTEREERAERLRRAEEEFRQRYGVSRAEMFRRTAEIGARERRAERARALAGGPSWTSLGPSYTPQGVFGGSFPGQSDSGLVNAIAIHPTDPKTIFIGPAGGGVWKTTDAGLTWTPLTDDIGITPIGALAIAPSDPNRVYAGCGSGRQSLGGYPAGPGLLVSTDGGGSWALSATSPGNEFWFLRVDPSDARTVLAGTDKGVQRSTDGGNTWSRTLPAAGDAWASGVASRPGSPDTLLVTTFRFGQGESFTGGACIPAVPTDVSIPSRLWRSTDGGVTFTEITTLPGADAPSRRSRVEMAFAPSDPSRVYAVIAKWAGDLNGCIGSGFADLYDVAKSTDGGSTWTALGAQSRLAGILMGNASQLDYNLVISVDPRDANVAWVGGLDEAKTADGGTTWSRGSVWANGVAIGGGVPFLHADQHFHAWAKDGSAFYVGNDGGIFLSTDGGATFQDRNRGLVTFQYYAVCQTPAAPAQIAGGAQDNGTSLTRDGASWTQVLGGDGIDCAMHPANAANMVGTVYSNSYYRTTDGGATWANSRITATGTDSNPFYTRLHAAPDSFHLYTMTAKKLWDSTDGGATWTVRGVTIPNTNSIHDISFFAGDPTRMVMGIDGGAVLVSTDAGTTFTKKGATPVVGIGSVRFDRADASTVFVTIVRTDPGIEHVFVSHDGGATFTGISRTGQPSGLPDLPVNQLEQDPKDRNVLYVINSAGVYRSGDAGASWQRFGQGLPNVWPQQMAVLPDGSKLRLATFGRGMWEISLAPQPVDNAPHAEIDVPAAAPTLDAGIAAAFHGIATDPDAGDVLTSRWDFGDGRSAAGVSASHSFAVPGTYTVSFTVTDSSGLSDTATRTVAVRVPEGSAVAGPDLLVPVVLDVFGAGGSHYTTELTLASRASAPVTALLQYTASAGGGSGWASVTLAPGESRVIPDAIAFLKSQGLPIPDDGARIGTLRTTFAGAGSASDVFAGGRTSTPGASGSFGLFYTASAVSTTSATIFGLQQNAAQRSNLALVNAGADPVTLRVQLFGPQGEDLGTLADQTLPAWGWTQINTPLAGKAESGRALVTRVAGSSPFTAYGVLNDAFTSDGSFVAPIVPGAAASADLLVPIVLRAAGYRSELTLANLTSQPLALTLSYVGSPQLSSAGTGEVPFTLAAGEQRILTDAIDFLASLGLSLPASPGNAGGTLLVKAPAGTPAGALAAGARTFTAAAGGGTFGLFYPGLALEESATALAFVNGLQQNASQRSNLAIANRGDAGDAVTLKVTFYGADGAVLDDPETAALAPGEWKQFNQPLGARGASAGFAKIERLSGSSRWVAYGILNDQRNSDGSYIPMSR